jgi:predicted dehydrogenase/threonine dehydrogenase-like Zn-dependent dehydrogenase
MQQLTQQLKSGIMEILEVPFPALNEGFIMVRNHFSVISAGTESKTVTDARKGYLAKAKSRKKEVRQVIQMVKANGLLPTYKLVMNKLEAPASLGYSCAGEVISVGEGVSKFNVGDYVACGGASAFHADVVAVPVNLAVHVPQTVDIKQAAFATIAAIAIQGMRQADLRFGENCLVIGIGIIGQLTYKILEASGMRPIAIDISEDQIVQSKAVGIENVFNRNQEGIEDIIMNFTDGYGVDATIITAGTSSLDPVEFAGSIGRKKGKVIIVGAVPTGFSRENYYKKELDLRMSSSYGPGRSDANYEEKGYDYPIGYVRWTENRNMKSFIDLLHSNRLDISNLISHTFSLDESPKAYDMIIGRNEPFAGVLIQYDDEKSIKRRIESSINIPASGGVNVGFIGAGSFTQGSLLPNMKGHCHFIAVAAGRGITAKYVGDKYGFSYLAENADMILADANINTVFITTRHNLHAGYVMKAIQQKKHIFVEKPLAMNIEELNNIKTVLEKSDSTQLMVGFNRRFAPAIIDTKDQFINEQPKSIIIRVNSGSMPVEHWVNDPDIGGGRIIGECCHFIDLAMYLAASPIVTVSSEAMQDPHDLKSTVIINLKMENGSVASINYLSNGNKAVGKEYIEVFSGGTVAIIDDFKSLHIYGKKNKTIKYRKQDKGHASCVQTFLNSMKDGSPSPIIFEELYLGMLATFAVNKSIMDNRKIFVNQ